MLKNYVESGKNFAFKATDETAELINRLFSQFDIDENLSQRDKFISFCEKVESKLSEPTETTQLTEENEFLKTENENLGAEINSLSNQVSALQEALEAERAKEPQTITEKIEIPVPTPKDLAPNEILIVLPYFQHHLLGKISGNSDLQKFYKNLPEKVNGIIQPLPANLEDKKALMSTVLINFFIGIILNYHKNPVYLPEIGRVSKTIDIQEAINYAKKKLKENEPTAATE